MFCQVLQDAIFISLKCYMVPEKDRISVLVLLSLITFLALEEK